MKLTQSQIDRQNILNNSIAIKKAEDLFAIQGLNYKGVIYYTNQQIADFFMVDIRTIRRLLEEHSEELQKNGYEVLKGKKLTEFREAIESDFVKDIDVSHKTRNLSISTFRTLLNFSMLLTTSEVAKEVRSKMLDIVIDFLAEKTGGNTKYINQRDKDYLHHAYVEESERKKFTDAIKNYVSGNQQKYGLLTNEVYKAIFKENAQQYKEVLKLDKKDKVRETMYSEVLLVIASFEAGLAYEFKNKGIELKRELTIAEAKEIINKFANHPMQKPHLTNARTKMASRDLGFRDALHISLEDYISPITEDDFEKFLGEQSKSLEKQIKEHEDVFLRLKDK